LLQGASPPHFGGFGGAEVAKATPEIPPKG
jgi:hypothetical protein